MVVSVATLATTSIMAQEATPKFSLENTLYGGYQISQYYPFDINYWLCKSKDRIVNYTPDGQIESQTSAGKRSPLISYNDLAERFGVSLSVVRVDSPERIWLTDHNDVYCGNIVKDAPSAMSRFEGPFDDMSISPTGTAVAMTDDCDLYIVTQSEKIKVNAVVESGVRYGSTVHRNEFGIEGGMFWSPDGSKLCFYRKDESMVSIYPLVDVASAQCASVVPTRYPMAGSVSEIVTIGVYDLATKQTVYLSNPHSADYLTNISWSPDSKSICVAEVNREQNHVDVNIYNAISGQLTKTLFSEDNEKWVEPMEPAVWTDNEHFLWLSYRDGFRHAYLYNVADGSCRQLTNGEWCITRLYGYNAKQKRFVIQANREGYLYRNVYALSPDGKLTNLSPGKSYSHALMEPANNQLIIYSSSPDIAKQIFASDYRGKRRELYKLVNPYAGFDMPQIRTHALRSADGRHELTGRIILPPNFDESRQYPVIVYVYGGPHSQLVEGSWLMGASPWMLYFAQEGYIVYTMDNRGTEMRGTEFEQCIHRHLGRCEAQDQMVGVNYLRSLPFVDRERIGVFGWSFGGFMTMTLLTDYAEYFKAGVAGGPVCDWRYYEVMYGERYMDTPQENPDGYEHSSLLGKIDKLKARLLVIHGGMDSTVVWQHSQQLINASIKKDVYIDYAIYPNHPHNVRGHDSVHLYSRIKRYFDDFLSGKNEK